jgi:hypothetical protein
LLGFILIPWRVTKLFEIAVTQYEGVPTRKIYKDHYMRELNAGHTPKRVLVVIHLFRFIVADYATVIFTVLLVGTLWRAINTIEILHLYFRHKFT